MGVTIINQPSIVPRRPLHEYKVLSYDIYGTLVDWESGILVHLVPLQEYLPASHQCKSDRAQLYRVWDAVEQELKANNPRMVYDELLSTSLQIFARRELHISETELSEERLESMGAAFGQCVQSFKAFPDTVEALKGLRELGYKLAPLSNIDNASYERTKNGALQGFVFDAVLTGQDIGSYKPNHRNFFYLFEKSKELFDADKSEILHIAHGLGCDHAPAKDLGLQSVWIERPGSATGTKAEAEQGLRDGKWTFGWQATTLGDLVAEMRAQKQA